MTHSLSRVALTAAIATALLAAVALAAPTTGKWRGSLGTTYKQNEGEGYFRITSGPAIRPFKGQKYIVAPSNFKCNTSNLSLVKTTIPISGGKFSYTKGAYPDAYRAPKYVGTLTWKGTFKSKSKVVGTIRFQSPVTPKYDQSAPNGVRFAKKPCDTGKLNWVANPSAF